MNGNMEFRRARREEAEEILQLYRSLIGTEYCVWTENYPTEREAVGQALFCLIFCSTFAASKKQDNAEMVW